MMKKMIALMLIITVLIQYSCEMKSENELYKDAVSIDQPQERINELEKFIANYPENKNKDKVLFRMFRDYVSLKNETKAVIYGNLYLGFFPKDYSMSQLNSVAWILAENKLGLDSAKVYADRAVKQAREIDIKTLNMILDTQAYVYFQAGDPKKALSIQIEAMAGNENSYDYLNRLGQYQHDAGEIENAYYTMAKSILLGGGLESGKQLEKWLTDDFKDEKQRIKVSKKIADSAIKDFIKDGITEDKKSQSAALLSILKVDLDKAEKWANEAVQSLNEDSEFIQQLNYNINLAAVYNASGNQSKALTTLQKIKDYASIYDLSYWLNLGNAYLENNQKEKAVDSFIEGMLWRELPEFREVLNEQGINENEIKAKIEKRKKELIEFHPGKFEANDDFAGRIVLTELFTGAECAPCKGADLALDLIAEYYPRSIVTILEYHLHIPGPDPLTNPDTQDRYAFYGKDFGTPIVFFNGQSKLIGGGSDLVKKDLFNKYKKSIEKYFSSIPLAKINLNAKLNNDLIEVNSEIESDSEFKKNLNLNIAIVEKSIDYIGSNGITKHAFVVRYLMTGATGEKIDLKENTFKYSDSINLSTIQNRQSQYLSDFANDPPKRFRNFAGWKETKEKINPEQLVVVAWIQNPETKEILQSQYSEF